jgi:hypothetical protein
MLNNVYHLFVHHVYPDIPNQLLNHQIYVDEENYKQKQKDKIFFVIIYLIVSKINVRRLTLLCTIAENA